MFKWPWSSCKLVKHNVFSWDEDEIVLVLKPDNPFGVDKLRIPNTGRYKIDQSQVYYKIMESSTNSTLLAIARQYVAEVIINSGLT